MRNLAKTLKTVVTVAVAAGALLGAKSAAAATGVLLIHGTSDHSNATADYWTQDTVNKIANGRKSFVASYQGSSCSGIGSSRRSEGYETYNCSSWSAIADQAAGWLASNSDITDVVIVTHSNGSAPARYMLTHPTSSANVATLVGKTRKVVYIAGDNMGTELADKVTTSGTFANIANAVVNFFGGGNYNTPAVWAQRRDRMAIYNSTSNGAYNTSSFACGQGMTSCGGKATEYVRGTDVTAALWSGAAWCGGYLATVGLKLTKAYAGFQGGCGDGFIGCDSAGYNGREVMSDSKLNHNQSRRDCRGMPGVISNSINNIQTAPPPAAVAASSADYTISPAAQACNATTRAWVTIWGKDSAGYYTYGDSAFFKGCTSTMLTDPYQDYDCQVSYGRETAGSTTVALPDNFASTRFAAFSCPDTLKGNGVCDMCIVAKYGFDGKEGDANGGDDCVNKGAGTTNWCSDLASWNGPSYSTDGVYLYRAQH